MRHRVLMLLSNEYRPDARVEKEAMALRGSGWNVTVLAWDREQRNSMNEVMNGIIVSRVRTRAFKDKVGLVLNYPAFLLSIMRMGRRMECEVVHAHDLDTLLPGIILARLKGVPLIYDAHEHYAAMVAQNLPSSMVPIINLTERTLVKGADVVIVANHLVGAYLKPWFCGEPVIIMNCIDPITIDVRKPDRSEILILYGGSLEPLRYIEELIRTTKESTSIRLRIAGDGSLKRLVEEAARSNDRVQFLGFLSHDNILMEMAMADVIPIMLDPVNENNRIATPIRLLESMALGVPVIVTKGTLSADIVSETGCGLVVNYDIHEFQVALDLLKDPEIRRRMGEKGKQAASDKYNWNVMKGRLMEIYSAL